MNFSRIIFSMGALIASARCASLPDFEKTVPKVELKQFMTKWYVIASRPTMFEKDAFKATETYTFNKDKQQIDIDFSYRADGPNGPEKKILQTGWVYNTATSAHWKIKPSWWWFPVKMDYLIIGLAPNYEWTAIGVPNQKYLWVMAQEPKMTDETLSKILESLKNQGYNTDHVERVYQ